MIQEVAVVDDQLLITLSGSIYIEEATALRMKLFGCIEKGHTSMIIDLSDVDYIDGSGLGTMADVHRKVTQSGGRLQVRGLNGFVKELFELTHLSKVLETQ